jgi:hypothetical protein
MRRGDSINFTFPDAASHPGGRGTVALPPPLAGSGSGCPRMLALGPERGRLLFQLSGD